MEQAWIAAIAIVSFALGATWMLGLQRLERRLPRSNSLTPATREVVKRLNEAVQGDSQSPHVELHPPIEIRVPINPHRRPGIAEMRARAEEASKAPLAHQASITAKNTKALESL